MIDESVHHQRRSIRLRGYDYTLPGAYFVTLVTKNRTCIFGEVIEGEIVMNEIGKATMGAWLRLPSFFAMQNDVWVLMPNHLHGIILLNDGDRSHEALAISNNNKQPSPPPDASHLPNSQQQPNGTVSGSLGAIIQNFKSTSTRIINQLRRSPRGVVWQRNYYEHIIRNDGDWSAIRMYIIENPHNWDKDTENPRP